MIWGAGSTSAAAACQAASDVGLGLARALLKRAPILLLDEPTANLDPASEQAMINVIRTAARGRTTLIATHSDAVAALADRVVRL